MFLRQTNFAIVLTILVVYTTRAQNNTSCERSCGGYSLQYPFGFSDSCEVRLDCSSSSKLVQIGEFLVQNVTPSSLFINLPAKCNRSLQSIVPLFGTNFAPTWNNSLLVRGCSAALNGCVIPISSFTGIRLEMEGCDSGSGHTNISCFTQSQLKEDKGLDSDVMTFAELNGTGCQFLFSSVAVGQRKELSLQFQVAELGWWLRGPCQSQCSPNATCTTINLDGGSFGFRCQCHEGFLGDGFNDGTGCRRGSGSTQGNNGTEGDEDELITFGFYVSLAFGFIIGFWGVCGTLILKRSWSYAFFQFFDEMNDWIYVHVVVFKAGMKRRFQVRDYNR